MPHSNTSSNIITSSNEQPPHKVWHTFNFRSKHTWKSYIDFWNSDLWSWPHISMKGLCQRTQIIFPLSLGILPLLIHVSFSIPCLHASMLSLSYSNKTTHMTLCFVLDYEGMHFSGEYCFSSLCVLSFHLFFPGRLYVSWPLGAWGQPQIRQSL